MSRRSTIRYELISTRRLRSYIEQGWTPRIAPVNFGEESKIKWRWERPIERNRTPLPFTTLKEDI